MTTTELLENFAAAVRSSSPGESMEAAAGEIAAFFGVNSREVAVYRVDQERRAIRFRWPPDLAKRVSSIPLKAFNSVVGKTAKDRCAIIDNSFSTTRHLHIFEHFVEDKEERLPVQKMMSVPVDNDAEVCGVIQVCRKGRTPLEAGPDFSEGDLETLKKIALLAVPLLARRD